ncbi:MAG: acetylornithine/succinylornithine family transaminase [Ignavibacteria bacterium]|nr:acetylornithine/succinylornithine family transaminase [Ignavibacteria bacterium]
MTSKQLIDQYEFSVYAKRDVVIVKGSGAKVWDDNGKEYVDCVAGIGVASVGHANPAVVKAISEQAAKLITCPVTMYNDTRAKFLEKLMSVAPKNLKRAFLTNSGTEAIEGAIKFARFTTKKTDFISAMKSFHGRTLGALSATFKKEYREDFMPLVPGFEFVPYNNFEKLVEKVSDKTAGIILEVIQGEGGVNIGDKEYFLKVRELCNEKNIILIIDEIQTGFCRTGKFFASNHFNLEADIMCVAKAIAGGIPMGAILCSEKIEPPMGKHGTTFGGNPLACSAGIAAIDFMIDNKLDQQAEEKGKYFQEKIEKMELSKVREFRRKGLMIGIELKEKPQPYVQALMERGVIPATAGVTVLRLLPPLVISYEEIDFVLEQLEAVLK